MPESVSKQRLSHLSLNICLLEMRKLIIIFSSFFSMRNIKSQSLCRLTFLFFPCCSNSACPNIFPCFSRNFDDSTKTTLLIYVSFTWMCFWLYFLYSLVLHLCSWLMNIQNNNVMLFLWLPIGWKSSQWQNMKPRLKDTCAECYWIVMMEYASTRALA